ncbi:hypothetical protein [Microvirga aerilata]|uniref:hypothetical protein n=1 Tax=Microvirga aerilata TaxID=670292 RepID=UPI0035E41181
MISAMEAVEELRAQHPLNSDEWQGWQLEIVDAAGRAVQSPPLDSSASHWAPRIRTPRDLIEVMRILGRKKPRRNWSGRG